MKGAYKSSRKEWPHGSYISTSGHYEKCEAVEPRGGTKGYTRDRRGVRTKGGARIRAAKNKKKFRHR